MWPQGSKHRTSPSGFLVWRKAVIRGKHPPHRHGGMGTIRLRGAEGLIGPNITHDFFSSCFAQIFPTVLPNLGGQLPPPRPLPRTPMRIEITKIKDVAVTCNKPLAHMRSHTTAAVLQYVELSSLLVLLECARGTRHTNRCNYCEAINPLQNQYC